MQFSTFSPAPFAFGHICGLEIGLQKNVQSTLALYCRLLAFITHARLLESDTSVRRAENKEARA